MNPGEIVGILTVDVLNRRWFRVRQVNEQEFGYITADGFAIFPQDNFKFDGGSIPPVVRWLLIPTEFLPWYCLHDHLCSNVEIERWLKDYYLIEAIYTATWQDAFIRRNLIRFGLFTYRFFLRLCRIFDNDLT